GVPGPHRTACRPQRCDRAARRWPVDREGRSMSRTALVIGCGGTIGGAWSMAALHALAQELEWDPRDAAIIQGTSAGAEMAVMLGGGFSSADLVDMQLGKAV